MNWLRRLLGRDKSPPASPPETQQQDTARAQFLSRTMPHFRVLPAAQRQRLLDCIDRFLREKTFWGNGGLVVTDEMKLYVAAYACLLILGIPRFGVFPRTSEIVIYPQAFGGNVEAIGPHGERHWIPPQWAGQASNRGPILLAWDDVQRAHFNPREPHNAIIHEFAHALDFLDGAADGLPPFLSRDGADEWLRVLKAEHAALAAAHRRGELTFLDSYGAQNLAEFFAVATEHFFIGPQQLRANHPALYAQLAALYNLDPAREWRIANSE